MTPKEVRELAKATCCWLAYKDLTGFGKMLSEATLSLPISEFLTTRTSWMLHSELYYRKLPGAANYKLPEFSCDFAGTRKGGKEDVQFILEAKYLKVKAENMRGPIASDFVRLALPEGKTLKRYFLLAGESQHFPPSNANFLFDKTLFGMGINNGYYIQPAKEITKPHLSKLLSSFDGDGTDTGKVSIPKSAYVTCRAVEENDGQHERKFRVMIWSIGLAKAD